MIASPDLTGKRLLFLINSLGGGGAEHVFVQQLNALHEQGVDVSLATLSSSSHKRTLDHLLCLPEERWKRFNFRRLLDTQAMIQVYQFIKKQKFDLIYSTLNDANALCRLLSFFFPRKVMLIREANTLEKKPIKFRWWDRFTNTRIKRIIAVSEEVRRSIIDADPGVAPKIVVLPNGVHMPARREPPAHSVLSLATVGRCVEQKNQALILEALHLARQRKAVPPFIFHLIGDGVLRADLEKQAKDLGLEAQVRFHGHLPPDKVAEIYREADVFVLSSRWEGCPNVLLEAMSWGIPSIATTVGGVPDVMTNDKEGLLVPSENVSVFTDALCTLMTDPLLRERLGEAAYTRIQTAFSFQRHIERLRALFHDSLTSSSV